MHYIYILYSEVLDRYYIGATKDISKRIEKHLQSKKGFTSRAKDWELKYSEVFDEKSEALKRERQIKSWKSRKLIEELMPSK